MERYKFLVSGPVGAGKTTAIKSASDEPILHTDVKISDTAGLRKQNTTVAMDYGSVVLNNGKKAHIYGTPGQERFDFMWEVLSKGTQGLVLLFDNSRNYPKDDISTYVSAFSRLIDEVPVIIGVTRMDLNDEPPLASYQQWLEELGHPDLPVMRLDGRSKEDVLKLLENLSSLVEGESITLEAPKALNGTKPLNGNGAIPPAVVNGNSNGATNGVVANGHNGHITSISDETEGFHFSDDLIAQLAALGGVTGVTVNNEMGETLHTSVDDEEFIDFSAFLTGVTPMIEESLDMGKISQVMMKSPDDDNVTFFIEEEQSLTVSSQKNKSLGTLTQQVKDVLQWS